MPDKPVEVDPGQRVIVNTDYDTSNIANMDEMCEHIIHTLDVCIDILKAHCGPQSGYAMLVNSMNINQSFEPNIFTRDGIRILSSVEFMSPLEKYIKDMLTYIGARVDNKAKDGTTTSMLFSAIFLKYMLSVREAIRNLGLSTYHFKVIVDGIFESIVEELDKYTYHVEDFITSHQQDESLLMKAAGKVAYIQALSSSGGNLELAEAMKEIFEKSPKVAWEFITSHNSVKETGKNFSVDVDEYDSRIRSIQATDQGLNYALNTQYIEEDVDILVYPGTLDDMSLDTDVVSNYLDNIPSDQPFCIITQHVSARLITKINQLNQLRKKAIVVWQFSPEHKLAGQNYPWELLLLCAIAGAQPLSHSTDHTIHEGDIIRAKKVHWHDTFLDIFGVVDMDQDTCLHPFYAQPDTATPFYTSVRQAIESEIDIYKNGKNPDGKMLSIFIEMLNRLATVHRPTLRCGGPVHEQVLNRDIVQDVQGAIMSSLNDGFVLNGVFPLYGAISHTKEKYTEEDTLANILLQLMDSALTEILQVLFVDKHTKEPMLDVKDIVTMINDKDLYINVFKGEIYTVSSYIDHLENNEIEELTYPVMQPVDITKELLKRISELLMKFVNTDKIIVYGGVVINKEQGDK